jgi:hypothetical protein
MKPLSFGYVFVTAFIFGFLVILVLFSLVTSTPEGERLIFSIICGVIIGLFTGYQFKGDTMVRKCEDQKKLLHNLTVRLTENRYSLESQTESLFTFKLPVTRWGGGEFTSSSKKRR